MGKVLKRMQFNNGYGCSCCRRDWEETEWINEDEIIDFETLLTETIKEFNKKASDGGCVGITYEKDGQTLYGIEPDIYKVGWSFYAVFGGEADYYYENELLIKNYEGVSKRKSYTVEEILSMYHDNYN